jgi:hypothetical protein
MNEKRQVRALVVSFATPVVALVMGVALVSCSRSPVPQTPKPSAAAAPDTVARIGDFVITRTELEDRLVRAIRPQEEEYVAERRSVTAESVLREMLAEKAMSMEGRKLSYLQDELIHSSITEAEQQRLAQMVAESCIQERLPAHEAEVEAAQKANPKLTPDQAKVLVQRQILAEVRKEFEAKFQLKKLEENFVQAALIHQRLLLRPVEPRGTNEYWIKNSQVRNELSDKEKNLVLATYQGGQFTLKDWFGLVCNIAPPRRPADLNTPAGVARLLENGLWTPLFVAEAKVRGYDKDPKLRRDIRDLEDQRLLYKVLEEKTKGLSEPPAEQVKTYFEKNQERFAQAATLKVNQIWCADLDAARKVKADLEGGADFEALKKAHSLQKDEPPHNVSAVGEGLFWAELWRAEPNQTVGPLRGFYGSGVKWRIVRIQEKTPARAQAYSEQVANSVKWALMEERRQRLLEDYREELLQKYPHEIFRDRIKDMDPLEIAMTKGNN